MGLCTPFGGQARPGRNSLVLLASFLAVHAVAAPAHPAAGGAVHALLINGGDRPASNYLSHRQHLEDMVSLLRRRGVRPERIHIFSADGEDEGADLASRGGPPPGFWLIEGTGLGNRLGPRTELTNTRWEGLTVHPARQSALREWFDAAGKTIAPGDQLLIFVTDHGTEGRGDPDATAISLWQEKLLVREFKALLARLPPGVRVVMIMSQCYSGAFARVSDGGTSEPSGDVCGFFSTGADQKAYGCYPEGRDRDRMGHAFRFIEALGRRDTAAEAHLEVLTTDDSPDIPLRTTDVYLARLVSAEATARKAEPDALVDSLLAEAWRDRKAWEAEIRLLDRIGSAFGTSSPRSLAELRSRETELEALARRMATYAERWQAALSALKESVLESFLGAQPEWRARLEQGATARGVAEGPAALLAELLPELLEYAHGRPETWKRLEEFRDHVARASEARWRLDVRKAAMRRMRTVLVGIAGRVLLGREPDGHAPQPASRAAQRGAMERLERCEASTPGNPLPPATLTGDAGARPFPPLGTDVALLKEISPSWLGVRFRAVPESVRASRGLPAGANFLDAVYPDSPAREAGLEAGDIVLGPPRQPFDSPRELREWTMTAPTGVPLPLLVVRPGEVGQADLQFEATLVLRTDPVDLPTLPEPPLAGGRAPSLPAALTPVGSSEVPDLSGRSHLLFFWATWCGPCKQAWPEVMDFAEARGLPVLAISDEDEGTVARFLKGAAAGRLPSAVAVDPLRKSFISYGISGTPTILLVDEDGVIRHRQVGYTSDKGLTVAGWRWPLR